MDEDELDKPGRDLELRSSPGGLAFARLGNVTGDDPELRYPSDER